MIRLIIALALACSLTCYSARADEALFEYTASEHATVEPSIWTVVNNVSGDPTAAATITANLFQVRADTAGWDQFYVYSTEKVGVPNASTGELELLFDVYQQPPNGCFVGFVADGATFAGQASGFTLGIYVYPKGDATGSQGIIWNFPGASGFAINAIKNYPFRVRLSMPSTGGVDVAWASIDALSGELTEPFSAPAHTATTPNTATAPWSVLIDINSGSNRFNNIRVFDSVGNILPVELSEFASE